MLSIIELKQSVHLKILAVKFRIVLKQSSLAQLSPASTIARVDSQWEDCKYEQEE